MNAFARCISVCVIKYHLVLLRPNQSRIKRFCRDDDTAFPAKEKPVQSLPVSPAGVVAGGFANVPLFRIGARWSRAVQIAPILHRNQDNQLLTSLEFPSYSGDR